MHGVVRATADAAAITMAEIMADEVVMMVGGEITTATIKGEAPMIRPVTIMEAVAKMSEGGVQTMRPATITASTMAFITTMATTKFNIETMTMKFIIVGTGTIDVL